MGDRHRLVVGVVVDDAGDGHGAGLVPVSVREHETRRHCHRAAVTRGQRHCHRAGGLRRQTQRVRRRGTLVDAQLLGREHVTGQQHIVIDDGHRHRARHAAVTTTRRVVGDRHRLVVAVVILYAA